MERLRRLNARERINWVEALPIVVDRYHDTPGVSDLSPYRIMFGRDRYFGNLPEVNASNSETASEFFARMQRIDERVAQNMLNMCLVPKFGTDVLLTLVGNWLLAG